MVGASTVTWFWIIGLKGVPKNEIMHSQVMSNGNFCPTHPFLVRIFGLMQHSDTNFFGDTLHVVLDLIIILLFTYMHVIYLWNLLLCTSKLFLEEKVLSQCSQGRDIPSKWWASMWFLIWFTRPSLPHILQMDEVFWCGAPFACLPAGIIRWPFSIIALCSKGWHFWMGFFFTDKTGLKILVFSF